MADHRIAGDGTDVDRINGRRLVVWCIVLAVSLVAATWLLSSDSSPTGALAYAVATGVAVLGGAALLAYRRFLHGADELTRRIQLEGVAFGFGVGLLFTLLYPLFEHAGAPERSLADAATVMIFAYVAGVLLATRRYR